MEPAALNLINVAIFDEINTSESEEHLKMKLFIDEKELSTIKSSYSAASKYLLLAAGTERHVHPKPLMYSEYWVPLYLESDFHSHFRMTRDTFAKLEEMLVNNGTFLKVYSGGNPVIPARKCIEISLWYLTHQDSMHTVADKFGVVKSTVHKCVHEFCKGVEEFAEHFIKWPNENDCRQKGEEFYRIGGFPGVIGCIDGTHIKVKAPSDQVSSYTDRYMDQSIVIQGICNHDKLFTNVFVGYPGSAHDTRVMVNSEIYKGITTDRRKYFPENTYHLLGDCAYGIREWLITPYRDNGNLSLKKRYFNKRLSMCRIFIEHAFGLVKGQFKKLSYLDVDITFAATIAYVICILHNFCLIHGETLESNDEIDGLETLLVGEYGCSDERDKPGEN